MIFINNLTRFSFNFPRNFSQNWWLTCYNRNTRLSLNRNCPHIRIYTWTYTFFILSFKPNNINTIFNRIINNINIKFAIPIKINKPYNRLISFHPFNLHILRKYIIPTFLIKFLFNNSIQNYFHILISWLINFKNRYIIYQISWILYPIFFILLSYYYLIFYFTLIY